MYLIRNLHLEYKYSIEYRLKISEFNSKKTTQFQDTPKICIDIFQKKTQKQSRT